MNAEQELRLQAWLDGELTQEQREEVSRFVASDKKAQELVDELRMTKGMLSGSEAVLTLPESREFFWAKVRLEIEPKRAGLLEHDRSLSWLGALRRFATPLSGMALVVFLTVFSMQLTRNGRESSASQRVEVENLCEDVGSISYKSQADNVFVVYLYDKERLVAPDAPSELSEESATQVQ